MSDPLKTHGIFFNICFKFTTVTLIIMENCYIIIINKADESSIKYANGDIEDATL